MLTANQLLVVVSRCNIITRQQKAVIEDQKVELDQLQRYIAS